MKRSIFFSFLFFLTIAAGCNELESEVLESWTEEQPKLVGYFKTEGKERMKVKEEKFYENGQMEYVGSYDQEGKRHGSWKYWYANGKLWSTGEFVEGRRTGPAEVYYENGNLRYKGQFKDNKEVGQWIFHKEDGSLLNEIDFDSYEKTKAPNAR